MTPQDIIQTLLMIGWRQVEISKAVGLTQPNISRIASGKQGVRWQYWVALQKLLDETPPRARGQA
jgi:plasmid maintenance system antidote protein VapI